MEQKLTIEKNRRSITGFLLKKGYKVDDGMIVHRHVYIAHLLALRRSFSDRKFFLWLINYDRKHVGYYRAIDKVNNKQNQPWKITK